MSWVKSSHPDYAGQPVEVTKDTTLKAPLNEDMTIVLRDGAKKYGVGADLATPYSLGQGEADKKTLVFQYEVRTFLALSIYAFLPLPARKCVFFQDKQTFDVEPLLTNSWTKLIAATLC
jgi:hypothetical protein